MEVEDKNPRPEGDAIEPPPAGSAERWCWDFIASTDLASKLAPGATPDRWERGSHPRRVTGPGRPAELRAAGRSPRTPSDLTPARARAGLLHTFLHHELQAAELFAWAVLAFPDAPQDLRRGLIRLCHEELGHLALYRTHLEGLGFAIGDFAVRDWFWQRVGSCADIKAFMALQGLGLEGANLEHSTRFAGRFRDAGDGEGARILEQVVEDEVAHVAFARRWFERLSGAPLDYDLWRAALPAPLTPALMQGRPLNREARKRAGQDDVFLERLAAEPPTSVPRAKGPGQ